MISDEQSSQMDAIIAKLQADGEAALYASQGVWSFALNSKDAASGAILQDLNRVQTQLAGDWRQQVIAGSMSYDTWFSNAKLISDDIAYQAGTINSWSFSSVASQTVEQTVTDVKEGATKVLEFGGLSIGIILAVGLGIYLFLFTRMLRA